MIKKEGRILKGVGGFYYVQTKSKLYECRASGLFRHNKLTPTVGDYVDITLNEDGTAYITDIKERKNLFVRPPVSNVDRVYIITSIANPKTNNWLLDRMILLSLFNGMKPNIVVNKIDLDMKNSEKLIDEYTSSGFNVLGTSIEDKLSIDILSDQIDHRSTVFMGASGVGKSSLINLIADMDLEVGEVSKKTARGRHTTRHVEIYPYGDDSFIIDTPGFSSLSLSFIENQQQLESLYEEFNKFKPCKFHNCLHLNEPNCSVKKAVFNEEIQKFRYDNYKDFQEEIKNRQLY